MLVHIVGAAKLFLSVGCFVFIRPTAFCVTVKTKETMAENNNSNSDLTPITVITGFLGAGKTTLVNYILKEQREWKICVLENEFGEVSIDDGLGK